MKECLFKVGDWVTAPYNNKNDFRDQPHIPNFKIAEISEQSELYFLRPIKGRSTGIESSLCTLIPHKKLDKKPVKKRDDDKLFIQHYLKFIKDTDYAKVDDGIDDFLEQYYEG